MAEKVVNSGRPAAVTAACVPPNAAEGGNVSVQTKKENSIVEDEDRAKNQLRTHKKKNLCSMEKKRRRPAKLANQQIFDLATGTTSPQGTVDGKGVQRSRPDETPHEKLKSSKKGKY